VIAVCIAEQMDCGSCSLISHWVRPVKALMAMVGTRL